MGDWSPPEPGLGERVDRFLEDIGDRLRDSWRPANARRLVCLMGVEVWVHRGWPIGALLPRLPTRQLTVASDDSTFVVRRAVLGVLRADYPTMKRLDLNEPPDPQNRAMYLRSSFRPDSRSPLQRLRAAWRALIHGHEDRPSCSGEEPHTARAIAERRAAGATALEREQRHPHAEASTAEGLTTLLLGHG